MMQHRLRVIIVYADAGSLGHRKLAENYAALLASADCEPILTDVLRFGGTAVRIGARMYNFLVEHLPSAWRSLYHRREDRLSELLKLFVLPRFFRSTLNCIRECSPDLVITTHPIASAVVDWGVRHGHWTGRWIAALSDWHFHRFWMYPTATMYFATSEVQKQQMTRAGTSPSRIAVTGLLLGPEYHSFNRDHSSAFAIKTGEPPLIVVMSGGLGWKLKEVICSLSQLNMAVRIVVISGNERRGMRLRKILRTTRSTADIRILGYVDPFELFRDADLILSKPGTLSTAQAIALEKKLVLIVPMPGHEEENAAFLGKHAGCEIVVLESLTRTLPELLQQEPSAVAHKLILPETPALILNKILELAGQ